VFKKQGPGIAVGAAIVAAALLLSGCAADTTPNEPAAQQLVYAPQKFPSTLNNHAFPAEESTQGVVDQVLDTLVTRNDDGEVAPRLALSWENPDPLTWVFELREDVVFSDGTPFTSTDVRKSIENHVAITSVLAPLLADVTDIDDSEPHRLVLTTNEPDGTILATLSILYVGQGDAVSSEDYWNKPVGTGPFVIDTYETDERIVLTRNESYWGEPATLDTVTIRSIPEASARIAALETGEVDMISNVAPDQSSTVAAIDNVQMITTPSTFYYLNWFNNAREPFTDERVRQALWHAADLETIIPALFGDAAVLARAPLSSVVFGAPELEPYTYDPELAKQLLADAGYPNGFSTTMIWPNDAGINVDQLAQTLISAWAEVGVEVEPISQERAQWTADFNALDWDMSLFANSTATGDAHYTLGRLYTCAANRLGFCDEEVDSKLVEARGAVDQDERRVLYQDVSTILWERAVGMFISELTLNLAYEGHVTGVSLPPTGRIPFKDISISD